MNDTVIQNIVNDSFAISQSASLLPPTIEVWGKVIFSQVFVCSWFMGSWVHGFMGWPPSMHHRSHDQEVCLQGVCIQGGLHPGGSASRVG